MQRLPAILVLLISVMLCISSSVGADDAKKLSYFEVEEGVMEARSDSGAVHTLYQGQSGLDAFAREIRRTEKALLDRPFLSKEEVQRLDHARQLLDRIQQMQAEIEEKPTDLAKTTIRECAQADKGVSTPDTHYPTSIQVNANSWFDAKGSSCRATGTTHVYFDVPFTATPNPDEDEVNSWSADFDIGSVKSGLSSTLVCYHAVATLATNASTSAISVNEYPADCYTE
jgi:hypothetical protein